MFVEVFKMEIMIKVFLLVYLLAMVLLTVFSVICILSMIFKPEWFSKNDLSVKYQYQKIKYLS